KVQECVVDRGRSADEAATRNAATTAPQASELERVAVAETDPAVDMIWSSTASLVLGAAGTRSSSVHPLPAVKVCGFADDSSPIMRSPDETSVATAVAGVALVPWPVAVASSELVSATPEYSRMANRSVAPLIELPTVTVVPPPLMFSA